MEADTESLRQLVQLYENSRVLWDPKHSNYYDKCKREDAWRKISQKVKVPVEDLKKKMQSLTGSFRREKSRIKKKKSQATGSGADKISSKWFGYTWFQFLYDKDIPKHTIDSDRERHQEDEETIENTDTTETIVFVTDETDSSPTTSNQESYSITPTPPVRRRQKSPPQLIEPKKHMEQAFNYIKQVSHEQVHSKNEDDECTIFGQLIASKIRKLSEERRDVMMVKINQLFVDEHTLNSPRRPYSSTTTYTSSPPIHQEVYCPQAQTETAPIEESDTTVDFLSFKQERE